MSSVEIIASLERKLADEREQRAVLERELDRALAVVHDRAPELLVEIMDVAA